MQPRFNIIHTDVIDTVQRKGWIQNTNDGYVIKRGTDVGFASGKEETLIKNAKIAKAIRKAQNISLQLALDKSKDIDNFLVSAKQITEILSAKKKLGDCKK